MLLRLGPANNGSTITKYEKRDNNIYFCLHNELYKPVSYFCQRYLW